jgi:hypothetical protein
MAEKKNPKPTIVQQPGDPDNLRAEYNALSAYFNTVVTFRFTTLGLYLAAVALLLGGNPLFDRYLILLVITFFVFLIEIRNQTLYKNLSERAMQIERDYWGYTKDRIYEPFYSHMMKTPPNGEAKPQADYPKIFGKPAKYEISHTLALNLLYGFIFLYALIRMILLLRGNSP